MSNSLEIVVNLYTVIGKVGSQKLASEVGNEEVYKPNQIHFSALTSSGNGVTF